MLKIVKMNLNKHQIIKFRYKRTKKRLKKKMNQVLLQNHHLVLNKIVLQTVPLKIKKNKKKNQFLIVLKLLINKKKHV
jgi:hypothetical protein